MANIPKLTRGFLEVFPSEYKKSNPIVQILDSINIVSDDLKPLERVLLSDGSLTHFGVVDVHQSIRKMDFIKKFDVIEILNYKKWKNSEMIDIVDFKVVGKGTKINKILGNPLTSEPEEVNEITFEDSFEYPECIVKIGKPVLYWKKINNKKI